MDNRDNQSRFPFKRLFGHGLMARKWDNIRVQRVGGRGSNVDYDMGNRYSVKVSYATNSVILIIFIVKYWHITQMKVRSILMITSMAVLVAMVPNVASAQLTGTVEIGGLYPLSGEVEQLENIQVVSDLAVEDFNAYLAESGAGWSLEIVIIDTESDNARSQSGLESLHARGITATVGPFTSAEVSLLKSFADENGVIMVSPTSTAASMAIPGDNIFRLEASDENQGQVVARILSENGIEAIVPVWRADTYGDDLIVSLSTEFSTNYGGFVQTGLRYNPLDTDFSQEADHLNAYVSSTIETYGADKVAVFVAALEGDGLQLFQAADRYSTLKEVQWFTSSSLVGDAHLTEDRTSAFVNDVDLTGIQFIQSEGPRANDLNQRIVEQGGTPTPYDLQLYDTVWVIGSAIEAAGSTDADAIKEYIPIIASDYSGAMTDIALNANGDIARVDYDILSIVDGSWTVVSKYVGELDIVLASNQPEGDVMIGSLYPLTGRQDSTGYDTRDATQLGADDFNRILDRIDAGWNMVIVSEDSATNPSVALEKVQTLYSRGIDVVIGPRISSTVTNAKAYADTNDMMLISCCSTASNLAIPNDSIFRLASDDVYQASAVSGLLVDRDIEAFVSIWRGDDYGDQLVEATKANFENSGKVSYEGVRYNPDLVEFSVSVQALADDVQSAVNEHGAENVAVFLVAFDESIQILQTASNYDVLNQVQWFGAETLAKKTNILNDPIASEIVTETNLTALQIIEPDNNKHTRVQQYFVDKLGEVPITYVNNAYDISWLVGMSILQTGATDAGSLKSVFIDLAENYVGAIGSTALNEDGDLRPRDYSIWEVTEDGWRNTGSYSLTTNSVN